MSFSAVTFVQSTTEPLAEVVRVLKPAGRVALTMWGPYYGEVRMASAARRSLGQPPLPSAAPGRAVTRLKRVGLHRIERHDLKLSPRFRTVDDYLTYRRAFGIPLGQTRAAYNQYLKALHREAARHIAPDGSLTIDWTLAVITAEKPRRTRRNPRR